MSDDIRMDSDDRSDDNNDSADDRSQDRDLFEAIMIISMQRVYDLLLFDIKQKYGDAAAKLILDQHARHEYMYPAPGGGQSASGPAEERNSNE